MIQKQPMQEKVTYMRSMKGYTDTEYSSFASGNMFESLALTNPEEFNSAKLEAILNSKNIVEGFHQYLAAIMNKDAKRFSEFLKEYEKKPDAEFVTALYKDFNIARYGMMANDWAYLSKVLPEKDIITALFYLYIPESLSEEGIKSLIRLRLANDQILVTGLMSMMEANFELFNFNSCEAQGLINNLGDKSKSDEAIGIIREKLKDPEVLNSFKDDRGNFDFRKFGGCYLIMRDKLELRGPNPVKYLTNIFKYDCIVYSHGGVRYGERRGPIGSFFVSKRSIVKDIVMMLNWLLEQEEFVKVASREICQMIRTTAIELTPLSKKLSIDLYELDKVYTKVMKIHDEIIAYIHINDNLENNEILYAYMSNLDRFTQPILDKHNAKDNLKDGHSANWTIQPVNTLTEKNITHAIDLIRTLKKEGFKNILIMSCNPGSIRLPKDIIKDKTFNVTMGMYSVLIEDVEPDSPSNLDYLNENLIDSIKYTVRTIFNAMKGLVDKCRKRFNEITSGMAKSFDKKFKGKHFNKTRISTLRFDGDKPIYVEVDCRSADEYRKIMNTSNESIMAVIDKISKEQNEYMKLVDMKYHIDADNEIFDI